MYIVHSGKVRLFTRDETGEKVTVALIEEGGFFGEMTLIDGSPRSATAVAEEDTCLIALDKAKFLYMLQQQPMFAFTIMHALCERIRAANLLLAKVKGKEASG
jgi:CRP-like cAMP-binding protein